MPDMASVVVSVDVEDWPQSSWDRSLPLTERSELNTNRLLDLLDEHKTLCTMFVLGKFAESFPETVKRVFARGHEVASHGYGHVETFRLSPTEFREDVSRSKRILEDLTGQPVVGYRAPDFSIVRRSLWALEILADLRMEYDSSIYPIKHGRYGIQDWPRTPVSVETKSGSLIELPMGTWEFARRRWPVAGGGYHRLLPWCVIKSVIMNCVGHGEPFIAYCHPYEFDPKELSEIDIGITMKTRLHQSLGRRGFQAKFEHILKTFNIQRAIDLAESKVWPQHRIEEHGKI